MAAGFCSSGTLTSVPLKSGILFTSLEGLLNSELLGIREVSKLFDRLVPAVGVSLNLQHSRGPSRDTALVLTLAVQHVCNSGQHRDTSLFRAAEAPMCWARQLER